MFQRFLPWKNTKSLHQSLKYFLGGKADGAFLNFYGDFCFLGAIVISWAVPISNQNIFESNQKKKNSHFEL